MLFAAPVFALLFAAPLTPVKYPELPALLDKVDTRFQQEVQSTVDGMQTLRVHKEELDDDGKVVHVDEEVLQSKGQGGSREFDLVSATEDGKDVTAERKAKHDAFARKHSRPDGHHSGGDHDLTRINPFAKDQRSSYLIWAVAPLPPPGAPLHLHFKPVEASKDRFTGDAWVDPSSGDVREITVTPSDLPIFVDVLTIHAVLGTASDPRATDVDIDGGGHVLFWHKHFRVHTALAYGAPDKT